MARKSTRPLTNSKDDLSTQTLARTLGVPAGETAWLDQALTHRSSVRERGEEDRESNERLEFLGDAVIQLVVSRMLYERYPRWSEGQLTRARSAVVSREPLFQAAMRMGLGDYLKLGKTEDELGGRTRSSILASAFEAVIAAVYLTTGVEPVTRLLRSTLDRELSNVEDSAAIVDFKTQLQEKCQALFHKAPTYRLVETSGAPHERIFRCEVTLADDVYGEGSGRSKKDAEQAAARMAFEKLPISGGIGIRRLTR